MMQRRYTKAAVIGFWLLGVGVTAMMGAPASTYNWVLLAVLAVIPPIVLWQLWEVPAPSMSEDIRTAMKD